MTFPGSLQIVTVTGTLYQGVIPCTGSVAFIIPQWLADQVDGVSLAPVTIPAVLGEDGEAWNVSTSSVQSVSCQPGCFSLALPSTDNVNLYPANWQYGVQVNVDGATPRMASFNTPIPFGDGTVDISSLIAEALN
jgi:hypothetical protein